MALHKDPDVTDRKEVVADALKRRDVRKKLHHDVADAKIVLNPGYQIQKLVDAKKAKARVVIGNAKVAGRKAAPFALVAGVGALMFAGRQPIGRWISKLRPGKSKVK